jgi:hypothetical protein
MGAIIGGISGFIVLMMTYFTSFEAHKPETQAIREVRMDGMVDSTLKNSTPGMLYPGLTLQPLRREDYSLVGVARGNGCAHYVALWPLPIFWTDLEGGSMKWFSANPQAVATGAAWYDAISSLPKADAMISPRSHVKEKVYAFWYRRDCVDLQAKGIEIHLDQQ